MNKHSGRRFAAADSATGKMAADRKSQGWSIDREYINYEILPDV
jgi:hypothetical protein